MKTYLYFAYGSNMSLEQMAFRCPKARPIGVAILPGYRLVERRFADIDSVTPHRQTPARQARQSQCRAANNLESVHGLLWRITQLDLESLDHYEGFPRFYTRHIVTVICVGVEYESIVYEMTLESKIDRHGEHYPAPYRRLCSAAAKYLGIPDDFTLRRQ